MYTKFVHKVPHLYGFQAFSKFQNYSFEVKDLNVNVGKEGVKKGDTIGILEVSDNGEIISQIDIVSEEDTRELLWFEKILRTITFGLI